MMVAPTALSRRSCNVSSERFFDRCTVRINSRRPHVPAMAALLMDRLWDVGEIVNLMEEWETKAA
jgi:hypothetical protein